MQCIKYFVRMFVQKNNVLLLKFLQKNQKKKILSVNKNTNYEANLASKLSE